MTARRPQIAVFTKNRVNPAYQAARLGAKRVAARFGATTIDYVPERPDDIDQQIALIDQALRERPDAVVLVPVHDTAIDASIRKLNDAGIPVINCINQIGFPEGYRCFVGSDDYAIAVGVAERLFEALGGNGDVVILEGPTGAVTAHNRFRGFVDAARAHTGIRVAGSRSGAFLHDEAKQTMRQLLVELPKIDGVLAGNDSMALGAIEALEEVGRQSLVVGVNAIPDAIAALKTGQLLATADFDAYKIACVAAEAAVRVLRGLPVPKEILLPVEIVDRSNCLPWDKPIEDRQPPEWAVVVPGAAATSVP